MRRTRSDTGSRPHGNAAGPRFGIRPLARAMAALGAMTATACLDTTLPVESRPSRSARLSLAASVSGAAVGDVTIEVAYLRKGGETVPIDSRTVTLADGTETVTLTVDITECLADPEREAGGDGCSIVVDVALEDGQGLVDAHRAGPVRAVAGQTTPVPAVNLSPRVEPVRGALAVGLAHACALTADGEARCWGRQHRAQTGSGLGPSDQPAAPTPVAGGLRFSYIDSKGYHTCGNQVAAEIVCWGGNGAGEIGDGLEEATRNTPSPIVGGPFNSVSPARLKSCALTTDGVAYCWGLNQLGTIGDPAIPVNEALRIPNPVATSLRFGGIATGWIHVCARTVYVSDGTNVYCWGSNSRGRLGTGDTASATTPRRVATSTNFRRIYSGGGHTCGTTRQGEVLCWGNNQHGALGDGTTTDRDVPTLVATNVRFSVLAVGTRANDDRTHSCGLSATGRVYCWGANDSGQLGDGTTEDRLVPVPVQSDETFIAVGAGDAFSCAMTVERRVLCWGSNAFGELGSRTSGESSPVPLPVPLGG